MKFSAIFFPNNFNTSEKMYFYEAVNLGFDDYTTKRTA